MCVIIWAAGTALDSGYSFCHSPVITSPKSRRHFHLSIMSGGDVHVLRQEAGQESPRMPAWKREILERRKAKGGGSGAGATEPCPSASSSRVNGEVTGNGSGPKKDNATGAGPSRNYTITPATQHFVSKRGSESPEVSPAKTNKDPWTSDPNHDLVGTTERDGEGPESLVLKESLGPLQENPFIKLEKERKKRQDRDNATRPVQHILELYGSVPGIRTIRADNIIIIESDPDYFPEASGTNAGSKLQHNGVSSYSSLNDLLDRRGSAVTEIRAQEVVIYDTTLSRSEENLSTLGRSDHGGSFESREGPGRVSRMLQKFDTNYGKLQPKSRSTENLLDLESSASRPRPRPKPQPDLVPKYVSQPQLGSPVRNMGKTLFFESPQSSKPKPQPHICESDGAPNTATPPQSVSSYRQRFEVSGVSTSVTVNARDETDKEDQPKPLRVRDWDNTEVPPKSKVPCSPETHRARADDPASPTSTLNTTLSPSFEFRPSPRPDLSTMAAGDVQGRALANLRLQSRNSFTVIPKRHLSAPSAPGSTAPSSPVKSPPTQRAAAEVPLPGVPTPLTPPPTPAALMRKQAEEMEKERIARLIKPDTPTFTPPSTLATPTPSPSPPPVSATPPAQSTVVLEEPTVDQLPVTNIDDFEVEPSAPGPSPVVQRKKGNTFTVVPKRKNESQAPSAPSEHPDTAAEVPPASTPPQAPYAQLGSLLKKRYPAVEEIEVIGGYLSLGRSCLSKTSSTGKKLKITFNESGLQSTFEYPSESSLWDSERRRRTRMGREEEEEEEEEEEGGGGGGGGGRKDDDQPSMVGRIHIPRPSFTSSPAHNSNSTDLSNYTPKHSVDFNAWQEHKLDDPVYQGETNSQMSEDVMLTPADSSSLSDFSSEPALYF
ncbi:LOW QUALITY PROTEIN: taperin [Aplochiton taeniatus]